MSAQGRAEVVGVDSDAVGGRPNPLFNVSQVLTLKIGVQELRVANIHIPSSRKYIKKDIDILYALKHLTRAVAPEREGVAASSRDASRPYGVIVGDLNEKHMTAMADRLRWAEGGPGNWRHWESERLGPGDHTVYSDSLERVRSIIDDQWRHIEVKPHYLTGGFFIPTTAETDKMVEETKRHVGALALHKARRKTKTVRDGAAWRMECVWSVRGVVALSQFGRSLRFRMVLWRFCVVASRRTRT